MVLATEDTDVTIVYIAGQKTSCMQLSHVLDFLTQDTKLSMPIEN